MNSCKPLTRNQQAPSAINSAQGCGSGGRWNYEPPPERNTSRRGGGILVKHVIENSESYNRGLRPNDKIISVNGIRLDNVSEQNLISMMDRLCKAKKSIELIYLRGNKRMKSVLFNH